MPAMNYLIYPTVTSWDEPPRARHQVAHELVKQGNVYFVEKNRTGRPRIEVRQVAPNLYVITPYFWIDYRVRYRTPGLNEAYHNWLLRGIRGLGVTFDMVFCFDFTAPAIHRFFDNVIFYAVDDNVGFGNFNPFFINQYHTRTERAVASRAQLCIVSSEYMGEKIRRYNPNTHVVPLGAPLIDHRPQTARIDRKGPSVLGLVGYLDNNLDYELLASLLGEFEIRFIGPASEANQKRLARFPNARLLGPKTGEELYRCLGEVDACIAPYDVRLLNKGATPNKLWLYLAMGKPPIITEMPNTRNWKFEEGLVYQCTNDLFADQCRKAVREDSEERALKRIELARNNSWEARIQQVHRLFRECSGAGERPLSVVQNAPIV
ncbi:hypothetical protein EPD60_02550 [Flaviaesturariibacter flavus]|uniref:Glycosyltransferase n=1 Tax=Flaviaesturariibacter flavus TaxID=2502780 RepID=A0A4R1BPC2_9BACT|nr:hypothetical protein [Flaviaesturariibacter flavus]TCJ19318.1 hypothetical protein EPD60_02550 [Flaviaesturariibacter flavus]